LAPSQIVIDRERMLSQKGHSYIRGQDGVRGSS